MGILSGVRVLDCSIAMAGPFAAQPDEDYPEPSGVFPPITGAG